MSTGKPHRKTSPIRRFSGVTRFRRRKTPPENLFEFSGHPLNPSLMGSQINERLRSSHCANSRPPSSHLLTISRKASRRFLAALGSLPAQLHMLLGHCADCGAVIGLECLPTVLKGERQCPLEGWSDRARPPTLTLHYFNRGIGGLQNQRG